MARARCMPGVRQLGAHPGQSLEQVHSHSEGARSDLGPLRLLGLSRVRRALCDAAPGRHALSLSPRAFW